jgi:DnaJ-domain-containing protein 1
MDYVLQIGYWSFLPVFSAHSGIRSIGITFSSILYYSCSPQRISTFHKAQAVVLHYWDSKLFAIFYHTGLFVLIETEFDLKSNYYQILGVYPNADTRTLKSAFRKLSLMFHPDKMQSDGKGIHQQFVNLREAYDILKEPTTRLAYDHFGVDVFSCDGCITYPEYMQHHMFSVGMFYAITAFTVSIVDIGISALISRYAFEYTLVEICILFSAWRYRIVFDCLCF